MEQSGSLEHEIQDEQNDLKAVLEDGTNSLPQESNASVIDSDEENTTNKVNDHVKEQVDEEEEEATNYEQDDYQEYSITESIIQITKSQVLASEQEEKSSQECHNNAEFITSTNDHMIESTYNEVADNEDQEPQVDKEDEEDEKKEIQEILEENEEDNNQEQEDYEDGVDQVPIVLDVRESSEDLKSQLTELVTSVNLRDVEETTEEAPVDSGLTDSCVDLGAEEKVENEVESNGELLDRDAQGHAIAETLEAEANNDDVANRSMEIIDKKQCEEDFEKVYALKTQMSDEVEPKRRVEDEVFEKPLGGDSLLKKITQYGEELMGRDWRPSSGQMCTISYEARLKDSEAVVEKNEDLSFVLGDGDVISAIDLVVSLMAKNEKCEMVTEARHAFGALGKKPDIPANATLCYTIHLKDFKDLTEFSLMEPVERLSLSEAKKLRGNFHFNRLDFQLAAQSYKRGLKYFDLENLRADEEKADLDKFVELRKALLMNLALSHFKLSDFRKALESLDQVLEVEKGHMKALYIKGKVLMSLGETQEAIKSLSKAHELAKDNVEVKNELAKAQQKHKVQYEKEKKMYQKMMASPEPKKEKKVDAPKKGTSPLVSYTIAGLLMAGATLGVAMFAKYKNLL